MDHFTHLGLQLVIQCLSLGFEFNRLRDRRIFIGRQMQIFYPPKQWTALGLV
ncbi:Uncharacterised protein [Vibrio cholerae]|nr:Uncharacterised protein [Vibrio cholerae]